MMENRGEVKRKSEVRSTKYDGPSRSYFRLRTSYLLYAPSRRYWRNENAARAVRRGAGAAAAAARALVRHARLSRSADDDRGIPEGRRGRRAARRHRVGLLRRRRTGDRRD